ncbi:hypothetical protein NA56DRAFT_636281 [Hyaloscypha hepaticicola]|uniref:Glyoxylate reductase n=1 Tax=Hyaloscypha hepaticicola TaxID=2082293 RepID=A0A2J6PKR7_9HELO|nr:hypothetical protein NA56DRAFT_636281 [Hyaloscypha hepaticicola]
MAPSALVVGDIYFEDAKWQALSPAVTLKEYRKGTRAEFISLLKSGIFDDVEAIFRSNESTTVTGPFSEEIISILPPTVKWLCHSGAGYDNIDVEACTQRGIQVSNTPNCNEGAVADLTIYLMIGALRRITAPNNALRAGKWRGHIVPGHDPKDKILGILGMGGIGKEVAKRAKAFGMKIIYNNRHPLPASIATSLSAHFVSFEELISTSDVISLHLALTPSTERILGAAEFEKMKTGVTIVNTARGDLIDEEAMIRALEKGKVWSLGLDVFDNEPRVDERFLGSERVVVCPHIGAATVETMAAMERLVIENIKSALFNGKLLTQVHEQISQS